MVSTGIAGLDDILRGGLTHSRLYLVEGNPGTGKTTLALQFLLEGVRLGQPTLYVTLSETKRELAGVMRSHGWDMDPIRIFEMARPDESLSPDAQLTMYHPSELELGETTKSVLAEVEKYKPERVVFDSLSEMRLLAQNPLRYRRQILALKQFFIGRQCTVLLLDDRTAPGEDMQLQSIAHGVIRLEMQSTEYGSERRRLNVCKMRGVAFRGGMHDFVIRKGGVDIFPRLVASEHHEDYLERDLPTGILGFDELLGGGLPVGSSTLCVGPAGVGKSTVALQFAVAGAQRGERAAIFIFDETIGTLRLRARKLAIPLDRHLKDGLITVQQVNAAELSPGEFVTIIQKAVEGKDASGRSAKLVMIDSLNGYMHSMPEENQLTAHLHELFTYLSQRGASALITLTQSGVIGASMRTPVDTTYLADNVIMFRYFESRGHIRRAVSVIKKRSGSHEQTIREMRMTAKGVEIGAPLVEFDGILSGIPRFLGQASDLLAHIKDEPAQKGNHGR